MSMSSTSATAASLPAPSSSRTSRLRRLSNLRAYTQSHLAGHSSSSTSGYRSYRNSLTRAVGLSLHSASPSTSSATDAAPTTTARADPDPSSSAQPIPDRHPCPETDSRQLSTNLSAPSVSNSSSSDLHSHEAPSSASSRSTPSNDPESDSQPSSGMVRHRHTTGTDSLMVDQNSTQNLSPTPSTAQDLSAPGTSSARNSADTPQNNSPGRMDSSNRDEAATAQPSPNSPSKPLPKPTIRFYAYQDPNQNSRPSLPFTTTSRTLPDESSVIRVGRYSERDGIPVHNPTEPSDSPVGFKSKVVSRRHCEFSFVNGQWHIKDVGSSSGTFLNHMRLSQPNMASRLYAVRDGDILQLGIDFRGGEEMIFRCVRIRIECNRTWQQKANEFNKNTASLINNLGKGNNAADYAGCRECSICLGSVLRPYQCLFMAACAHVWHYKCIRRLIHTPEYPMFQCPNCRAYTDLNAEVDDSNDPYEDEVRAEPPSARDQPVQDYPANVTNPNPGARNSTAERPSSSSNANRPLGGNDNQLAAAVDHMVIDEPTPTADSRTEAVSATGNSNPSGTTNGVSDDHGIGDMFSRSPNIDIPNWGNGNPPNQSLRPPATHRLQQTNGESGNETFEDNPLTPRNDLGPLAFDGRAGRL
ncbi:hypothetical protein AJ79_07433 [Helicocarpus griseus UAMH5409]|uniref:FHA domain-containing protein n=1 Tax=Helicocarpus griseus UAMH5409 TaxID=1447875 RepID=A0A2B7X3I1_9EURO|nr:hypothetical protein AJ79_07433 [Helicocarpus griseus UAMH5409]